MKTYKDYLPRRPWFPLPPMTPATQAPNPLPQEKVA